MRRRSVTGSSDHRALKDPCGAEDLGNPMGRPCPRKDGPLRAFKYEMSLLFPRKERKQKSPPPKRRGIIEGGRSSLRQDQIRVEPSSPADPIARSAAATQAFCEARAPARLAQKAWRHPCRIVIFSLIWFARSALHHPAPQGRHG